MHHQFTLLRYLPDLVKGEFVNLGVALLDQEGRLLEARMAGEKELRRLVCLHPGADLELLREAGEQFGRPQTWRDIGPLREMSTTLALTDPKATLAPDMDGLFERYVAAPPRAARKVENPREQLHHRIEEKILLAGLKPYVRPFAAAPFTVPGDSFRIDSAYTNGHTRLLHAVTLDRAASRAAQLAFTFERIRRDRRHHQDELTAIFDAPADLATPTRGLLESAGIEVRPFAEMDDIAKQIRRDLLLN